jgi:hypothetical protein
VGNILRAAAGGSSASTETYALPQDVAEIAIAEEEPERTKLSQIVITTHAPGGSQRNIVTAGEQIMLDAEDVWTAVVPSSEPDEKVTVTIAGYYLPYSWAFRFSKN